MTASPTLRLIRDEPAEPHLPHTRDAIQDMIHLVADRRTGVVIRDEAGRWWRSGPSWSPITDYDLVRVVNDAFAAGHDRLAEITAERIEGAKAELFSVRIHLVTRQTA